MAGDGLAFEVRVLGVNGIGTESGNAAMVQGRTLPWLQDVPGVDAWVLWGVRFRDVVILDAAGVVRDVFNLTDHDLADPANQAALRQLLVGAGAP